MVQRTGGLAHRHMGRDIIQYLRRQLAGHMHARIITRFVNPDTVFGQPTLAFIRQNKPFRFTNDTYVIPLGVESPAHAGVASQIAKPPLPPRARG